MTELLMLKTKNIIILIMIKKSKHIELYSFKFVNKIFGR